MNQAQAIVIAVLQGITELFPVSSLGHHLVLPALLGWDLDKRGAAFLPFLVLLHVGTAAALLPYFWRDWPALALGVVGAGDATSTGDGRRLLLVVVATIPAVALGFASEHAPRAPFGSPLVAATFLAANEVLLLLGGHLRARSADPRPTSSVTVPDAPTIGPWRCTTLMPGISRNGATIVGGRLRGIDHDGAAHFSILIATPVVIGATVLEVPKLPHASTSAGTTSLVVTAAALAVITALLITAVLMRCFRRRDAWALRPFALYCVVAGVNSAAYLARA